MNKNPRIAIELLAPPFLATALVAMIPGTADTMIDRFIGFPSLLFFAYVFGIVPSVAYMIIMELWFKTRLCRKFGLKATIAVSGVLGVGGAFAVELLSNPITQSGWMTYLLPVGLTVGLILGFYVGRKESIT